MLKKLIPLPDGAEFLDMSLYAEHLYVATTKGVFVLEGDKLMPVWDWPRNAEDLQSS